MEVKQEPADEKAPAAVAATTSEILKEPAPRDKPTLEPVRWNVQPPGMSYIHGRLRHKSTNHLQYIQKSVLKNVMEHHYAWPFMSPVDAKKLNIPVSFQTQLPMEPMDLHTIKQRLENNFYLCLNECIQDFIDMFNNCYVCNQSGEGIVLMAQTLQKFFLTRVTELLKDEVVVEVPTPKPPKFLLQSVLSSSITKVKKQPIAPRTPVPRTPKLRTPTPTTPQSSLLQSNLPAGTKITPSKPQSVLSSNITNVLPFLQINNRDPVLTVEEKETKRAEKKASHGAEQIKDNEEEQAPRPRVQLVEKKEHISKIRLSRYKLERWVDASFLKKVACGAFVRINIGQNSGESVYRVAEIVGVCEIPMTYKLGETKTNKGLRLRHGSQEKVFSLEFVSNQDFTYAEFKHWKDFCAAEGVSLPLIEDVDSKYAEIQDTINYFSQRSSNPGNRRSFVCTYCKKVYYTSVDLEHHKAQIHKIQTFKRLSEPMPQEHQMPLNPAFFQKQMSGMQPMAGTSYSRPQGPPGDFGRPCPYFPVQKYPSGDTWMVRVLHKSNL